MHTDNRIRNAFKSIEARQELKSSTLDFLQNARQTHSQTLPTAQGHQNAPARTARLFSHFLLHPSLKLVLGTVCVLFMLFLGAGSYAMLYVPVSYVSIDVNPSIELSLNRLDRVICATAYNADGQSILERISVDGKYYTDAIDLIMDSPGMEVYLVENAMPTFTVAAGSSRMEQLLQGVQNTHGCSGHGGSSYAADIHTLTEAHAHGLSFGKYAVYQILSHYDANVTIQDCQHMSMGEIHDRIAEHGHDIERHHNGESGLNGNTGCDSSYENPPAPAPDDNSGHGSSHGHRGSSH